jgi:selenocysteine lyase/cysteine desulfurase
MLGAARVEARLVELASRLKAGLKDLGAKLVTPEDPRLSGGVCIVEVRNERRQQLLDALYDKYGIAGAASGGLRLCPHLYNTTEHVDRAIAGVKALRELIA